MYYNDIIDTLQRLIYRKPTQQEIADALGVRQTAIAGRAKRNSEFSDEEIKLLQKKYNVKILSDNQNLIIDYYPNQFGVFKNGSFITSDDKISYEIPASIFPCGTDKKYSIIRACENSMYPLIWKNDYIIIEHDSDFINGEIYVFCYEDEIYIKRLTKNINQLVIKSENPDFPVQFIENNKLDNLFIIGKVIYANKQITNELS